MVHTGDDPAFALVEALAAALDADDFATVHDLLAEDCTYEIDGERHEGPDAVVASYRAGSARCRRLFDGVEFGHELLDGAAEHTRRVRYTDRLRAGDEVFLHLTDQDITVDPRAGITRILDRPVPGERARLDDFMARHGISRTG